MYYLYKTFEDDLTFIITLLFNSKSLKMKTKHTFTVIFFTRKSRSNLKELSIYVRITINGKRSEISLKRVIPVKDWDSTKSRGRGSSPIIRGLNAYLEEVYRKLLECHKELMGEGKFMSSEAIKA